MGAHRSPTSGQPKAADADLLGEEVRLPRADTGAAEGAGGPVPAVPRAPLMPEPPPAEDQNQPGFIGERNRPAP